MDENQVKKPKDLNEWLEDVHVDWPDGWENSEGPKGWWAVSTGNDGIIAYFCSEVDAFRFRLDYINRIMNP